MNNIESRVLEMKFDNEQFESAVATTMSTLDKFKEKLRFNNDSKGLKDLSKATSNYQWTINDVGEALSNLERRFSTVGTIGARIFENLTDSAYGFVTRGIGNIVNSIVQGGQSRAMNLEQARFQLEGILGDSKEVHRVIYDDILPQLQGTPFSLDQAAVVMGQLAASGVKASEDVKMATKAISGAAAMTNSSFADMGNIFVKVAGNGKIMGDTFQQFSSRGLNAAADVAEYLNKVLDGTAEATDKVKSEVAGLIKYTENGKFFSELDIREFTSNANTKNLLSYDILVGTMTEKYGAQAQKSTQMYTGALEDLKAALARVGAEPAALRLNFLRDAFNALVPAVDAVNAVIKPWWNSSRSSDEAFKDIEEYVKPFTGPLAQKIQKAGWSFQKLFVQLDENNEIIRVTRDNYKKLGFTMKEVGDGVYEFYDKAGKAYDEKQALMNPEMLKTITFTTKGFVQIIKNLARVMTQIGRGFKAVFPRVTLENIAKIAESFFELTRYLTLGQKALNRIRWIARGLFTPLGLAVRAAVFTIKLLIEAFKVLYKVIVPVGRVISSIFGFIAHVVAGIGTAIRNLGSMFVDNLRTIGNEIKGANIWVTIFTKFRDTCNSIARFLDILGTKIYRFLIHMHELPEVQNVFNGIKTAIETIIGAISLATSKISGFVSSVLHLDVVGQGFKNFWTPIKEFSEKYSLFDKVIGGLKNLLEWIGKLIGVDTSVNSLSTALTNLQTSLGGFTLKPANKIRKWLGDFGKSVAELLTNLDQAGYVSTWLKDNFKVFGFVYKLGKPIKKIIEPLGGSLIEFAKAFTGIKSTGELITTAGDLLKSGFEKITTAVGILFNNKTGERFKSINETLFNKSFAKNAEKIGKGFNIAIQPMCDAIKILGDSISKYFGNLDTQAVKKVLVSLVLLLISISYMNTLHSAHKTIKGFLIILDKFSEIFKGFSLLAAAAKDTMLAFKAIAKAITGVAYILAIAASLVIFAAALKILSTIDVSQMWAGLAVLAIAVVGILALFFAIDKIDFSQNGNKALKLATAVLSLAGSMMLLALAIKVIAAVGDESGWDSVLAAVTAIGVLIAFITAFGMLLSNRAMSKNLNALGWSAVGLGQGVRMLAEGCKILAQEMNEDELERGISAIETIIFMFAVFAAANWHGNGIGKAAFSMVGIAIAISIVARSVKYIGKELTEEEATKATNVIGEIILFFGLFAFVVGLAAHLGASSMTATAMVLSMTLFVKVLGESMTLMAKLIPGGKLNKVTEVINSFLAVMAVIALISAVGGKDAAAGPLAIAAVGIALVALAEAINMLAQMDVGDVSVGFIRLGVVLAGLIGVVIGVAMAMKFFSEMIKPKDALGILAIAAGMTLFALTIKMLSELPLESLKVAIIGLVAIMAAAGIILAAFEVTAPGMLLVAAAFALVGAAALFIGAGIMLVTLALSSLIPLIVALGKVSQDDLNAGLEILKLTASGLKDVFYDISDGVMLFGVALIAAAAGTILFAVGIALVGVAVIIASLGVLMLAGSFAVLASVLDAFVPQIKDSVLGTLGTLIGKVGEFFGNLRKEKEELDKEMEESEKTTTEAAQQSTKSVQDTYEEGKSGVLDSVKGMFSDPSIVATATESGEENGLASLTGFADIIKSDGSGIMSGAFDGIVDEGTFASMNGLIGSEGAEIPNIFGGAIEENSGEASESVESMVTSAADAANSSEVTASFTKSASNNAKEWGSTLEKSEEPKNSAKKMSKSAADATTSGDAGTSWNSAGQYAARGFATGMTQATPAWVTSAARRMASAAIVAARGTLQMNSPSKVFIAIGKGVGEGFVMGIDAMTSNVERSTEDLMDNSIGAAKLTAAAINAATSIDDFTPTITPVVDLTKVDQSVSQMGSMFNTAFGVATPFGAMNAALAASSFADSRNQNDKIDSINKLANRLEAMTDTMNSRSLNNYINIDGSTDPEAFADGLIRSFRLNARTV